MCDCPRFYVTVEKFGWSVRDRQQGEHPRHARVGYFGVIEAGSWSAAQKAAEAMADKLNAGARSAGGGEIEA